MNVASPLASGGVDLDGDDFDVGTALQPWVIHAVPTPTPTPVPSFSTRPFGGTAAAGTASSLPVPGSHDIANPACSARSLARRTGCGTSASVTPQPRGARP